MKKLLLESKYSSTGNPQKHSCLDSTPLHQGRQETHCEVVKTSTNGELRPNEQIYLEKSRVKDQIKNEWIKYFFMIQSIGYMK